MQNTAAAASSFFLVSAGGKDRQDTPEAGLDTRQTQNQSPPTPGSFFVDPISALPLILHFASAWLPLTSPQPRRSMRLRRPSRTQCPTAKRPRGPAWEDKATRPVPTRERVEAGVETGPEEGNRPGPSWTRHGQPSACFRPWEIAKPTQVQVQAPVLVPLLCLPQLSATAGHERLSELI